MTTIRSVRVLSAAKVTALIYGILGLLFTPLFLLGPGLAMLGGSARPAGFAGMIFVAVFFPICYAIVGFLGGALMAFLYNAISHAVGGIEVELELPPPTILNLPSSTILSPRQPDALPPSSPLETPPSNPPEFE